MELTKIFILDYLRTPIGCLMGNLSSLSCKELSFELINKIIERNNLKKTDIDMLFMGNVLSSGLGQNLAGQVSYLSELKCPSITVNRVCSSGMESIIEGIRAIKVGDASCVIVGGSEFMSNSPYLCRNVRKGNKYGNITLEDSMLMDGLLDPFSKKHMGEIAEEISEKYNITREEQDEYAIMSYKKAIYAKEKELMKNEILPITINGKVIDTDEQIDKINFDKIKKLESVFKKSGTITAGNASSLADGCSVILLVNEEFLRKKNLKSKIEIISYDQSVENPNEFARTPVESIKKILKKNKLEINNVDIFEINEAFSIVPILCHKYLNIGYEKINLYGGAISLGHPIGCSGNRIVCTLCNILENENKNIGCASICNGGGGATSILIKKDN